MAIPNLNFRGSIKSQGGRFAPSSAGKILDNQFKGLSPSAKAFMMKKLGSGEIIHADDFGKVVAEAHKKGYISSAHAEQMMDVAKAPDKFNEHWK